jgi:nucleotide-binding universal stress UspA family protein
VADILVEIDHVLRVVGAPGSIEQFQREWNQFRIRANTLDEFSSALPAFVERLAALPRTRDPRDCPKASLIVMGKRSHTILHRWMLGSNTERVLKYAHCPVMIVH